jgi:hypothetical protein
MRSKRKNSKKPAKKKPNAKETAPPKKRGRPSNAELAERTKTKRLEQDVVREQLLAAIQTNVMVPAAEHVAGAAEVLRPKYPVFFMGEEVCMGWWENLYEGYVVDDPDPVNGALVRIKWDDGRISWHAKENLRSTHKQKQRKVKRVIYGDQQRAPRNLEDTSDID